jgi:putative ABC transport system permease protein
MAGSTCTGAQSHSLVIAALMVSLAMAIGMSLMVLSFRHTVADWVDTTISADLYIAPQRGFPAISAPACPRMWCNTRAVANLRSIDTIRNIKTQIGKQPVLIAANELPSLLSGERDMRFVETTTEWRMRFVPSRRIRVFSSASASKT